MLRRLFKEKNNYVGLSPNSKKRGGLRRKNLLILVLTYWWA